MSSQSSRILPRLENLFLIEEEKAKTHVHTKWQRHGTEKYGVYAQAGRFAQTGRPPGGRVLGEYEKENRAIKVFEKIRPRLKTSV